MIHPPSSVSVITKQNIMLLAVFLGFFLRSAFGELVQTGSVCTVTPLGGSSDDTPQIKKAFSQCSKDSQIIFQEGTYNIRQVMEFTNLKNVSIDIYGKWVWSADNLQYWISNTLPVNYAGLHTGWKLGGTDIALRGHGKALFDGNGQVWIDENRSGSNRKGRPINLTIWKATNVFVDGITWRQSQFWHTFVAYSKNVTMTNLDMRTRSNSQWSAVNTDGIDTWNSEDVTIRNWTVECYDDCISVKGNSKNIVAQNITCYESGCAVIGSLANGATETVDNVLFQDFKCNHSSNAAWIKTYPGQGHVRNVTFRNFEISDVDQPIYVTSCIYSGQNCDGSRLPIEDITWDNIKGTSRWNVAAGMHCSSAAPCKGFTFKDIDIRPKAGGTAKVLCSNIKGQADMGLACTGTCPAGWPQQLKGNR